MINGGRQMRILLLTLLLFTISSTPIQANTDSQARQCFSRALADAEAGLTFAAMVEKYLDLDALTRAAARFTPHRRYDALSPTDQTRLATLTATALRGVTRFQHVELDSVTLRRGGKRVGNAYQVNGTFQAGGQTDTFSFLITANCRFVDGVWNNITFSRHIGAKF